MSETKGPQRLGKAATNLNVSKDTIIEFLKKKGVTVDNNPMAKIEGEVYDMLCAEFSTDQKAKEVVQALESAMEDHGRGSSESFRGPEFREIGRWVNLGGFLWTLHRQDS